MATFPGQPG